MRPPRIKAVWTLVYLYTVRFAALSKRLLVASTSLALVLVHLAGAAPAQAVTLDASLGTFNFSSRTNLVGDSSSANDVIRFNKVTTISGYEVDAVLETLVDGHTNAVAAATNPPGISLSVNTTAGSRFRMSFYQSGTYTGANTGLPVTLSNFYINAYDIDTGQWVQFSGFQTYRHVTSKLTLSSPVAGDTRFTGTVNGSGTDSDLRLEIFFTSVSTFEFAMGPSGAYHQLAFGPTSAWSPNQPFALTSNPNNRAPTSSNDSVNVAINANQILAVSDFGNFADADGNPFTKVKIESLPSSGTLQKFDGVNWVDLVQGAEVTTDDIRLDYLRIAAPSENTSITFKVNDALVYSTSTYTLSFTVAGVTQTIDFPDPGTKRTDGDVASKTFASNATASSGLTVTLASNTTGICTVSGLNITVLQVGTCSITASQSGNGTTFGAAPSVTRVFFVSNDTAQTISFADPGNKVFGSNVETGASASSTLVVTLISQTTSVCTISGLTINIVSIGSCTVIARQSGGTTGGVTYAPASDVTRTFLVSAATPVVTLSYVNQIFPTLSSAATLSKGGSSGGASYALAEYTESDAAENCAVNSSTGQVTASTIGKCKVEVTVAANGNYLAGSAVAFATFQLPAQAAISVTGPSSAAFGTTVLLDAVGGSGTGARTFSVTGTGCTITSVPFIVGEDELAAFNTAQLTKSGAGTCSVTVTKSGDANYAPATSSAFVVTFDPAAQQLSFTSIVPAIPSAGDTYRPVATATSGLNVLFAASGSCTFDAQTGLVSFNSVGACTITASQAGNDDYLSASAITQVIEVGQRNQSISFASISNKNFGDPAFRVSASSSASLTVALSSANTSICTVDAAGLVVLKTVGTCTIHADQAGQAGVIAAASRVSRSFEISPVAPAAPYITAVSATSGSLTATLIPPSNDGGATITRYELQAFDSNGDLVSFNNDCQISGPQLCTVSGLTNSVSYTLKARAHHASAFGELSQASVALAPVANSLAVRNLIAVPGDQSVIIDWEPPADLAGANFVTYDIYYRAAGAANFTLAVNVTCDPDNPTVPCRGTYQITGLTDGVSYEIKVVTITSVDTSEAVNNTAVVLQRPFTAPSAVQGLTATEMGSDILITWRRPAFDGGSAITSFAVSVNSAPASCSPGTNFYCVIPKNGVTTFNIDTTASNAVGPSAAANFVLRLPTPPAASGGGGGFVPPVQQVPVVSAPGVGETTSTIRAGVPTALELTGSNFNLITGAFIGSESLQFEILSNEKIRVIIPARTVGVVTLELRYSGGKIEKQILVRSATNSVVNAGSFRGVVALYIAGHQGQRFSAKVGRDWIVINRLESNYVRVIERVGAGRKIAVNLFIDRKLVRTIDLVTK